MLKGAYISVITKTDKTYLVEVPELNVFTDSNTLEGAIEMGRDAMGEMAMGRLDMGMEIIAPKMTIEQALEKSEYKGMGKQFTSYIDVDFAKVKMKSDNKAVRRNVTLPNWLNILAEESGLNVSKVLQDALIQKLNIS